MQVVTILYLIAFIFFALGAFKAKLPFEFDWFLAGMAALTFTLVIA